MARLDCRHVSLLNQSGIEKRTRGLACVPSDNALGDDEERERNEKLRVRGIVGEKIRALDSAAVQAGLERQYRHRNPRQHDQDERSTHEMSRVTAGQTDRREHAVENVVVE